MDYPKIYSYTIIRSSTKDFADKVPYCAAVIEMEDGTKKEVLLDGYTDGMEVCIGATVKAIADTPERYTLI